jgi:hypothetical protein
MVKMSKRVVFCVVVVATFCMVVLAIVLPFTIKPPITDGGTDTDKGGEHQSDGDEKPITPPPINTETANFLTIFGSNIFVLNVGGTLSNTIFASDNVAAITSVIANNHVVLVSLSPFLITANAIGSTRIEVTANRNGGGAPLSTIFYVVVQNPQTNQNDPNQNPPDLNEEQLFAVHEETNYYRFILSNGKTATFINIDLIRWQPEPNVEINIVGGRVHAVGADGAQIEFWIFDREHIRTKITW